MKETEEEKKLIKTVRKLPLTAFLISLCMLTPYFIFFHGDFSSEQADWGTFGDFLGGVMGVVIGLLTLMILALAYVTQREELRETREELKLSRIEQANASKALADQNKIALNRAKVSELMEASRLIHEELLRYYQSESLIQWSDDSLIDRMHEFAPYVPYNKNWVSLKDLHYNYLDNPSEALRLSDHENLLRQFESFKSLINELIDCYKQLGQKASTDGSNPLIQSILSYWKPIVIFMHQSGVPFDEIVMSAYSLNDSSPEN